LPQSGDPGIQVWERLFSLFQGSSVSEGTAVNAKGGTAFSNSGAGKICFIPAKHFDVYENYD